jgi:ligand-binding SRPBCC domain-containing protein
MGYTHRAEQWLPYPIEAVFAFFANPDNLPVLMPKWQKARLEHAFIVPPVGSGSKNQMAGAGSRITFSFRPFPGSPIRVRWDAEITEFALNSHFTDEQAKGPFAFWTHTHSIRNLDRAGINITVITDQVEYEPPLGMLGRLANRLFLRKQLERTFAFRQARLAEILGQQLKPVVAITQPKRQHQPRAS